MAYVYYDLEHQNKKKFSEIVFLKIRDPKVETDILKSL